MKIVISGIAGFLGSHLADHFIENGHTVWGFDNLVGGYMSNVPEKSVFFNGDTVKDDVDFFVQMLRGCNVLYHCAAAPYEGVSSFSPNYICENIYSGSIKLFTAAIKAGVRRIVFCSSMARYGIGNPPFIESDDCQPVDPYGISKYAAERVLINLCETHGVEWVIAVPHNIYGERQKYDDPYRNVASIITNRLLLNQPPIIYGDGEQKRCFSYISDCIDCLGKMALQSNVVGQIINIGPDQGEVTINQLCSLLRYITAKHFIIPMYVPDRPREVKSAFCSSGKAKLLLGYETKVPLVDGLKNLVAWIEKQGPKPFDYSHLQLELVTDKTPRTWTDHLI